jgi:AsmA family
MNRLRRILWSTFAAVLVFGFVAPFFPADWLRPRIEAALEAALNRGVHISGVRLNLFTGPGFTVKNVLIDDDPAAGIEPFAHVESMQARVSLFGLLAGHLAFSSLRLSSPSVNLVRMASGPWNVEPLLDRASHGGSGRRRAVPDIQIRDGRLNFKFGDNKSVFYISDADVDVYPNESGEVVIRFSGAPARTDRASQDFGLLSARGLLRSSGNGAGRLNLGIHLERTAISEVMRLFNGRDLGVHGFAIANATVTGPLARLEVAGDLNISDVHRWDLMPTIGQGWTLKYRGLLNLAAHQLDLETLPAEGQSQAVSLKLRLVDYLAAPKWAVNFLFRGLPAQSLLETARHLGAPLPPQVEVEGKINGGIGYSNEGGLEGQLAVEDASLKFPDAEAVEFDSAPILLSKNRITLAPATVRMGNGQAAEIEGQYAIDDSYAALRISTRQLTIAEVQSSAAQILKAAPIPVLEQLRHGTWKGWIGFNRVGDQAGVWSGEYDLQNASMAIPGLSSPVHFTSGSVEMKGGQIRISRIQGHAGPVDFDGDYRFAPGARLSERLHLRIPRLQLADLEQLMLPTLRREEGFLARTFGLRSAPAPKWLEQRNLDAAVEVGDLLHDDMSLGAFQAHLAWNGLTVQLSDIQGQLDDMRATGTLTVNLAQALPSYQFTGSLENFDYRDGELNVDGELTSNGIGQDLILNLRSQGMFEGREISLGADSQVGEIRGAYRIAPGLNLPRVLLSNLEVTQGEETLYGQGSVQPDGRVVLDLASGPKQVRLTGSLLPIHPEPVPGR